jgi:hypothetical protein
LSRFLDTFYTFEADTPAGRIVFTGTNRGLNAVPFPAQERMLATWAWAVSQEAATGDPPDWVMALAWERQEDGGCRVLQVYLTGLAQAFSCDRGSPAEVAWKHLESDDLAQLYDWYDRFQPTRTGQLELSGGGAKQPDDMEIAAIDRYAQSLYAALASMAPGAAGALAEPFATAPFVRF